MKKNIKGDRKMIKRQIANFGGKTTKEALYTAIHSIWIIFPKRDEEK